MSNHHTTDEAPRLELDSDLWLDQTDAEAQIADRLARGSLTAEQADKLHAFARDGYLIFPLDLPSETLDAVVEGVDGLWRDRPADVAFACDTPARPMARADEARDRRTRYRIHDLHSHVDAARQLYLSPQIFEWVKLVLGDNAVAIQSLFFEFGSEQMLHRDPVVVPTGKPSHLLAAWIALEDISPDCGALVYVPGSHRLPYYAFAPGQHMFDHATMGEAEISAAFAFDDAQCREHGLEQKLLTAKKGEVLLWHASLRHGGAPVRNPALTRKSMVVHFSTLGSYDQRGITVFDDVDGEERPRVMDTDVVLRQGGCAGFDNPMRGTARAAG